jgi:hypothetical protein
MKLIRRFLAGVCLDLFRETGGYLSTPARREAMERPLKLNILSEEQVSQTEEANRVPVYRIKSKQRSLMGWAQRDNALRGAREIRIIGDDMETEVLYRKTDT